MWSEAQREGKRSITYPSITNQYITNDNYWHLLAVLLALATAIFHHFSCFTQKPRNNDSSVSDRRNNQEKLFLHSKVTNDYYVLKFNIFPLSATFRFSTIQYRSFNLIQEIYLQKALFLELAIGHTFVPYLLEAPFPTFEAFGTCQGLIQKISLVLNKSQQLTLLVMTRSSLETFPTVGLLMDLT